MKKILVTIMFLVIAAPGMCIPGSAFSQDIEYDPFLGLFEKITIMEIALAGMRADITHLQADLKEAETEVDTLQIETADVKKKMYAIFLFCIAGSTILGLILNHKQRS